MSANEKPDGLEAELARRAREIESRVDAINLAAQPAQAGEAVAWGYRGRDGKIHPAVDRLFAESLARALSGPHGRPDNGPWEAVPLYTHPTPRAQPAPEWAGEKCPRCACERNTRGAVSGANGRFAGACSDEFHGEAPDPDATPRAEAATDEARALLDSRTAPEHAQAGGAVYPCRRCGTLRTKAEGGTTFTVCDECWDATHPARPADAPAPASAEAVAREAAEFALREFCRMEDIPLDRIQPSDISRAVAHALRAQRPGGAA